MTPGTLDLTAQRWVPFVYLIDFPFVDLTDATFASMGRLYKDAPGAPLFSLANAASNAEGVSVSVATGVMGYEIDGVTYDNITVSTVQIRINETTIEGVLPFVVTSGLPNRKPGDDVSFAWDFVMTGGGFAKSRFFQGLFTIEGGATV